MAKRGAEEPAPRDGRALLSAGGLLLAVTAVFVLGAVLHREVPVRAPEPVDRPAEAGAELHEAAGLDGRAARDLRRAAALPGAWTLQLVVACQEEGVQRLLDASPDDDRLYVLPREVDGRSCWAVAWGIFASEPEAAAAAPPASLRLREPPRPRALASYTP